MTQGLGATVHLRWNAGVLEQGFSQPWANAPQEWREVPDVLPRRDELPPAISRKDIAAALATGEVPRGVRLDGGREAVIHYRVEPTEAPRVRLDGGREAAAADPDFREVGEPARGAFYEFTITAATPIHPARLRSVSPVQIEGRPGLWREVLYDRKPEPLRDTDRLTYETVAEILRSHSSPAMGAPGSVHGGQRGFIVYETDGLPFIVSRLAELATLDDGRTAKDMLHEQSRSIDQLEKLADYQAEEITRLEDTARLGLSDDPAAGATLAAVMKERDELRAALPNFESHVAELTREFDEALAVALRERDELREKLRNAHAFDDRNQAAAAHERDELRKANDALNVKCMRQDTEVAVLRNEIEETRGKRNEWQRRAVTAERERDVARKHLVRVRNAAAEIVGNLQS